MQRFSMLNYFNYLDADSKMDIRNSEYLVDFVNIICEMLEIEGIDYNYKNYLISQILLNGSAYIEKTDSGWIICGGHFYGVPEPDKIYPNNYIATKPGFEFDGNVEESDGTVCWFVPELVSNTKIFRYADMMSQADTSLVNNIIFARIAPIISAKSDSVRASYEKALDKMISGELCNVIKDTVTPGDERGSLPVTNVSDAKYSEKIQYLSMFKDQIYSWFCQAYGIRYNHNSKQANITNDELHCTDDFCAIAPTIFKNNINIGLKKLGLKADFSKPWKWINEAKAQPNDTEESDDSNSENTEDGEESNEEVLQEESDS